MLTTKQRAAFSSEWRSLIDTAESLGHAVRWSALPDIPQLHGVLILSTTETVITAVCFKGKWGLGFNGDPKMFRSVGTRHDELAIAWIRRWLDEIEGYKGGEVA